MKRFLLCLLLVAQPALAEVTSPSGKTIDCYCTDKVGARVELGQVICLTVGGRSFMARCEMSLNTPLWREIGQGCMSSSLDQSVPDPAQPALQSAAVDAPV